MSQKHLSNVLCVFFYGSVDEKGSNKNYSLLDFLSLNMKGKVIVSMQLPKYSTEDITIRTFKTSPRMQVRAHLC